VTGEMNSTEDGKKKERKKRNKKYPRYDVSRKTDTEYNDIRATTTFLRKFCAECDLARRFPENRRGREDRFLEFS